MLSQDALGNVVEHVTSSQSKLVDAYALQHDILFTRCAPKEMGRLLLTILGVLASLGEVIPDEVHEQEIALQVRFASANTKQALDDGLVFSHVSDSEHQNNIMQAYYILMGVAYIANPRLFPYFAARWVQYCLKNKVSSKYTAGEIS
jgi:hypothetical protein